MPEASLPNARRDEDNTFDGKTKFNKPVVVVAGATGKGATVAGSVGNADNLLEVTLGGVVIFSVAVNSGGTIETLSMWPGGSNQGILSVATDRFRSGYDGEGFIDSGNKEAQIRAGNVPNIRVGQGAKLGFYNAAPVIKPTVSGAKSSNAALASLLTALAALGVVTDTTTT